MEASLKLFLSPAFLVKLADMGEDALTATAKTTVARPIEVYEQSLEVGKPPRLIGVVQ